MVMSPAGNETDNHCAGESQKRFTVLDWVSHDRCEATAQ
jgi:hypothetical protein